MNFPMQYPIFQFFYWLVNTPGVGGIIVMLIGAICTGGAFFLLRWIAQAAKVGGNETYSFPEFTTEPEE
jgi:hypothetical protein